MACVGRTGPFPLAWRPQLIGGERGGWAPLRSDYMVDEPSGSILQVELNTIASSFGCLSTKVRVGGRDLVTHT